MFGEIHTSTWISGNVLCVSQNESVVQFSVTKWNEMKWEFTNVLAKIAINRNSRMQNFGSAGVDDYVCTINGLPLRCGCRKESKDLTCMWKQPIDCRTVEIHL